jgi:hypothetical protein
MVRLDTITSPHSPAYLSISRQLDCLDMLPVFTLPELAAYMTANVPTRFIDSSTRLAEVALRDWLRRGAVVGSGLRHGLPMYRVRR